MQFKVTQKNTRQSPRKVRLVANTIKDLSLADAIAQLAVMDRRATLVILKCIKQAIANAKNNHGVDASNLKIKEILVNEGPRYRRFRAVSRGQAHGIIKRTSHISVTLEAVKEEEAKKAEKEIKAKQKQEAKKVKSKALTPQEIADQKTQEIIKIEAQAPEKVRAPKMDARNTVARQKTAVRKSTSK